MCGIAGTFGSARVGMDGQIDSALDQLRHRGPDDRGSWQSTGAPERVSLGQTRLSIIDLSAGGHQPMIRPELGMALVFNGEIYNYVELRSELQQLGVHFATHSDTEVLLAAWAKWGKASLRHLKGMFAFAVYDEREETLTCVRDGFGIKPLYFALDDSTFSFASEVPALRTLLAEAPGVNYQRLYEYLVYGRYDHSDETFWSGLKSLPAGHLLEVSFRDGHAQLYADRWWNPPVEVQPVSFNNAVDEIRERFLDNVRLHLRSDVPLGAALSGGVDSSAIVGAVRHVAPDVEINTFSYVARGSSVDEEWWVDLVNRDLGARGHKIELGAADLAHDLDDMILTQGEPFGSTSIYAQYRVYKLAKEQGVTVTLDGQGADELLAGYQGYPGARMSSLWRSGHPIQALGFARNWSQWPGRSVKSAVSGLGADIAPGWLLSSGFRVMGQSPTPPWLNMEACKQLGVRPIPVARSAEEPLPGRRLAQRLRQALTAGDLSSLLRHGDRNSMRWSVESRVPFLTTDLAEFCLSLPEEYLISPTGETKHVFRHAMRGIAPKGVLERRDKVGFETPEAAWLRELRPTVSSWLDGLRDLRIVDVEKSRRLVNGMLSGTETFSWQAWRLINASRWLQLFG